MHSYNANLVANNKEISCRCPFIIFFLSKLAARVPDVLASVNLEVFHATDVRSSKHSEEKVYEVYTRSGFSWRAVSIRTGAASYKQLV